MSKHETALTEGQLAEFLGAGVKALTLIANDLGPELAHNWSNNGQAMQRVFLSSLAPQETQKQKENQLLKLITDNLILDATDGKETLVRAKDVFSWIDPDFENWDTDVKSSATKKTPVAVYEIVQNATFVQMFDSLSSDVKKLCLTQAQIKNFVKKFRNWLRTDGWATLFLFEANYNFFVAYVYVNSAGSLYVYVNRFEDSDVWYAACRHRLVVPQLA